MISEKHKYLKDCLMILLIVLAFVVLSFIANSFSYSFNNVNHYELGENYLTHERKDIQKKIEIINDDSGRLIIFNQKISTNVYYFDYFFDLDSGSLDLIFINDIEEPRELFLVKDGLFDALEKVYYYEV